MKNRTTTTKVTETTMDEPKGPIKISFKTDIIIDFTFWAVLPSINLNIKRGRLEFRFLCLSIYTYKV